MRPDELASQLISTQSFLVRMWVRSVCVQLSGRVRVHSSPSREHVVISRALVGGDPLEWIQLPYAG